MKHQREVGTGYFDSIANAVSGGLTSTAALTGSTEEAQFSDSEKEVRASIDRQTEEDEILVVCFMQVKIGFYPSKRCNENQWKYAIRKSRGHFAKDSGVVIQSTLYR